MHLLEVELALREIFCTDVVRLMLQFLRPVPEPFEWFGWRDVAEYDSRGNYGHVPMCPIELPLF